VAVDSWQSLLASLTELQRAIGRVTAVNVNAASARESARSLVQGYFRQARPDLLNVGVADEDLEVLDGQMQRLLQLANGRNAKSSYTRLLGEVRRGLQELELLRERRLGDQRREGPIVASSIETRIIETLRELVPSAALSYEQALRDLNASADRVSFRGTAVELREALRETLDHLAPDEVVMAAQGFRLEQNQTGPTQKQKVRFILRSRRVPEGARKAPEDAATLIDELVAGVARASYQRGSLATHVASTEHEVRQLKMYVDSVLAELLQVHR
jgi:hypothetical protein